MANPVRKDDENIETINDTAEEEEAGKIRKVTSAGEDPFGNEEGAGIKYKTMTWCQTAFVMIAETVSLGILSLPSTLKAVGLIPGIILLVGLGILATYTGYVLGQFKLRYPQVHTFAEAGGIIAGRWGYEIFALGQLLFLVFVMGAHILSFSIMMNVLTDHATCTIWFTIAGFAISLICTLPRTMKAMSYMSYLSSASVLAAVFICMIGVGVSDKDVSLRIFNSGIKLYEGFGAVTNIIFAYAGHVAFFTLFSEMKDPKEFHKALYTLQITDTILYTVTAVVIYCYTGDDVRSPALGSTGPLLAKIAYGIALPTIVIAGVINGHVAVKYLYIRLVPRELVRSTCWKSYSIWVAILSALWLVAWIIASAIPVFNNLLGLISALFLSWFTYGVSGYLWLFMNRGNWFKTKWNTMLTILNAAIIPLGVTIMILGLYSSGEAMKREAGGMVFSCADNSLI
ncbi:amino acid transporter [Tricharina praecox]|uniref:amino acid transporter n=1 Tax=Tricharina praecox TaxID=43433 RepID=UPI00221F8F7B|nr:amino acid transporter [Tricharina praecox]KAI5857262.1 amino acid transporter [Tricharina praecox]